MDDVEFSYVFSHEKIDKYLSSASIVDYDIWKTSEHALRSDVIIIDPASKVVNVIRNRHSFGNENIMYHVPFTACDLNAALKMAATRNEIIVIGNSLKKEATSHPCCGDILE